jgi:thioredoxin-related protein
MRNLFKLLLLTVTSFIFLSFNIWQKDFDTARRIATEKNQLILLNFSGSDWCGPCIRMEKEIFSSEAFMKMAESNLVLLNADFPRFKKNQLSKEQRNANDLLAEKYNREGKFPFTVLLTPGGNVVKTWEGLPDEDASGFTSAVKKLCDEQ